MALNETKAANTSITLQTLVFLIFLILKLAEVDPIADWSWWWVTSPLWIPTAIALGILFLMAVAIVTLGSWGMTIVIAEWIKDSMKKLNN